jgi:hypothetical protein
MCSVSFDRSCKPKRARPASSSARASTCDGTQPARLARAWTRTNIHTRAYARKHTHACTHARAQMHARISMHRLASDGLAPLEPHIHTIDAVTTVPELMAAYVPPNSAFRGLCGLALAIACNRGRISLRASRAYAAVIGAAVPASVTCALPAPSLGVRRACTHCRPFRCPSLSRTDRPRAGAERAALLHQSAVRRGGAAVSRSRVPRSGLLGRLFVCVQCGAAAPGGNVAVLRLVRTLVTHTVRTRTHRI